MAMALGNAREEVEMLFYCRNDAEDVHQELPDESEVVETGLFHRTSVDNVPQISCDQVAAAEVVHTVEVEVVVVEVGSDNCMLDVTPLQLCIYEVVEKVAGHVLLPFRSNVISPAYRQRTL